MKPYLIITGTHLTPALALIDHLKGRYQLTYLGKPSQLLNIPVISFSSPKLNRHHLISIVNVLFKLPFAIAKAFVKLQKLKPNIIISFGGYVSLPICVAGKLLNIPIIIHEQTFGAGLANKLTSKLAKKIAISWPESTKFFDQSKTILTGNLLRSAIITVQSKLKSSSSRTIYITGGNQGSKVINQTINQLLPQLLKKYTIIHQFGLNQTNASWQEQLHLKKSLPQNQRVNYTLQKWFDSRNQAQNMLTADLIISRAGANTITELGYLSKPAILIPLPFAQKNEQLVNANYLKSLGLAVVLPQSELTPKTLFSSISRVKKLKTSTTKFPHLLVKHATANLTKVIQGVLSDQKKNQA